MADALSLLPASLLTNLSDKLYEKRKNAALEVEEIVRHLLEARDHDRIKAVINLLAIEFTYSPQADHRKGGLIGLAAATAGLSFEAALYIEAVRGDFIVFFNEVFDALCKLSADSDANVRNAAHLLNRLVMDIVIECDQLSIEEFIALLRERMYIVNPFVCRFLIGWIPLLDRFPTIDMLYFLPEFLDALSYMLSDSSPEIRQQAESLLSEFLHEIDNSPYMTAILASLSSSKNA